LVFAPCNLILERQQLLLLLLLLALLVLLLFPFLVPLAVSILPVQRAGYKFDRPHRWRPHRPQ
jgi:hypothetical protein